MGFFYKLKEGNLMIYLVIGLLLLTVVLVNFGEILTANIYLQSVKKLNIGDFL